MYWLTIDWWKYLLAPRAYNDEPWWHWLSVIRCRAAGHPCGVIWFNAGGYEPDMTCKNCGDDLG